MMRFPERKTFIMLAVFLLGVLPARERLSAREGIRLGRTEVTPYFDFRQQYRSNVYLAPEEEVSDFITFASPGLRLYHPRGRHRFGLDYRADFLRYADEKDENTTRQFATLEGSWEIGRDYEFELSNRLEITDEPETKELIDREDRTRNTFDIAGRRKGRRFTLGGGFTSVMDDYRHRDDRDRTENYITLDGYYAFRPLTDLRARYRYGEISYDEKAPLRDASYNELSVGISGALTPKLGGHLLAGVQHRVYEDPDDDDLTGGVISARVGYLPNPRVRAALAVTRSAEESTFGRNRYYMYTRVDADYRHRLGRRHAAKAGLRYQLNDYPEEVEGHRRKDNIWRLTLGWDYDFRENIRFGASYELRRRDSDFPPEDLDYTDSRVSAKLHVSF